MTPHIEIRHATERDAEAISHVICAAIRQVNAKDYPPSEIDRLLNAFSAAHVRAHIASRLTFVAQSGTQIIGTGALQQADIKSVFVLPSHHRRGVGTAVMERLEEEAKARSVPVLSVSSSLSAVQFYSSLGFEEQQRNFWGREETVHMLKAL